MLKNGRPVEFRQTFVAEVRDGLVSRRQAYEPYGQHGLGGFFLGLGLGKMSYRMSKHPA